jgi:hypothetical protein
LYKNHILTDSKLIQLASQMAEREGQNLDDATVVDSLETIWGGTEKAYEFMAQLSG